MNCLENVLRAGQSAWSESAGCVRRFGGPGADPIKLRRRLVAVNPVVRTRRTKHEYQGRNDEKKHSAPYGKLTACLVIRHRMPGVLVMKRLTPAAVTLMTVVVIGLLVTAYFAKMLLAEEPKALLVEAPKTLPVEFREIPMALGTLEPGTQVTAAHLGTGQVRADSLVPETLLSERGLIGRVVKEPIQAATPIRSSQLYQPGERPPLAINSGMRAVSVSFSPRGSFVGGLLRKGQFVDVYLTPHLDESSGTRFRGGLTITLLSGVRVLAVGGASETDSTSPDSVNTVTLELTPEQANILILAREKGEIALSYNPDGKGSGPVSVKNQDRATMDEILGLNRPDSPKPAPRVSSRPFTSESYKGSARTTLQFEGTVPVVPTDESPLPSDGNQP